MSETFDGTHVLRVLGREGDVRTSWDPANAEEVAHARATFEDFRQKGYLAYRVEAGGRGTQVHHFEPGAAELLLCPPLRGG